MLAQTGIISQLPKHSDICPRYKHPVKAQCAWHTVKAHKTGTG